jgi:membrane protein involved in colicin uptake
MQSPHRGPLLEVFSDTTGVDFKAYFKGLVKKIRKQWYSQIPEAAKTPTRKKGDTSVGLEIARNGRFEDVRIVAISGEPVLDQAACTAVIKVGRHKKLPKQFKDPYASLQVQPRPATIRTATSQRPPFLRTENS